MISARKKFVLVMLAVTSLLTVALTGCGKKEESKPTLPSSSPEVYMRDPVFRKALSDKRLELQKIVRERAPLVERMEELVRANGEDLSKLQKLPEWNNLHKRVVELNAKYEAVRQRQLKILSNRIAPTNAPVKEISK